MFPTYQFDGNSFVDLSCIFSIVDVKPVAYCDPLGCECYLIILPISETQSEIEDRCDTRGMTLHDIESLNIKWVDIPLVSIKFKKIIWSFFTGCSFHKWIPGTLPFVQECLYLAPYIHTYIGLCVYPKWLDKQNPSFYLIRVLKISLPWRWLESRDLTSILETRTDEMITIIVVIYMDQIFEM